MWFVVGGGVGVFFWFGLGGGWGITKNRRQARAGSLGWWEAVRPSVHLPTHKHAYHGQIAPTRRPMQETRPLQCLEVRAPQQELLQPPHVAGLLCVCFYLFIDCCWACVLVG